MKRSQLKGIYLKTITDKSLKAYKKRKDYVSRLYKKGKKIFVRLNPSIVSEHRKFWKTVKSFFPDNANYVNDTKLVENTDTAKELNNFFKNVMGYLNIPEN